MKSIKRHLVIRADADAQIGNGHLMRCFAFAEYCKAIAKKITFITSCNNEVLLTRLQTNGFYVERLKKSYPNPEDWKVVSRILADDSSAWIVLDGYHFDSSYQLRIKDEGHPLIVVDDMNHLHHYYADILLNQNIGAENLKYSCEPYSHLLLGTRYVILRREFLTWKGWKRETPQIARKLMVTLGGSDPNNVTLKIIQTLTKLKISGLHVKVVAGPSHSQISTLHKAANHADFPVEIFHNAQKMADLMAWADLAISAAGTTCWEMAFMGVPFATIILAKNQEKIAEGLDNASAAINLGWHSELTSGVITDCLLNLIGNKDKRTELILNGNKLVDGLGVERVLNQMVIKL